MRILLLISFFAINAYSQQQQYPPIKDEYQNIEQMLNKLEGDVNADPAAKAQAAKPQVAKPQVAKTQAVAQAPEATPPAAVATQPSPTTPAPAPVTPAAVAQAPEKEATQTCQCNTQQAGVKKGVHKKKKCTSLKCTAMKKTAKKSPKKIAKTKAVDVVAEPAPVKTQEPAKVEQATEPAVEEKIEPTAEVLAYSPVTEDGVKAYVNERSNKNYLKQKKIAEGLGGPSKYTVPTRYDTEAGRQVYHYAYMPPVSDEGYNKEGIYEGKYGQIAAALYGSYDIMYKGFTNRRTYGFDIQLGWQIPLDPFAIAILVDAAARGTNDAGKKLFALGPRVRGSYRVCSWFFPFLELGIEFSKLEQLDHFTYPYRVLGGGFMFRLGRVDRKAEFNLHKDYEVSKMSLIIGGDIITSPNLNPTTPDSALIKFGLGIDLF